MGSGAKKKGARKNKSESPVPLSFSSLSLLRTVLHYLNAWNRLTANQRCGQNLAAGAQACVILCIRPNFSVTTRKRECMRTAKIGPDLRLGGQILWSTASLMAVPLRTIDCAREFELHSLLRT